MKDSKESGEIYCSIDLELSGFDPSKSEILEVGLVFFRITPKGFHIFEEWSSVFRPRDEVKPNILGLTGITQEELNQAPKFTDFRDFLSGKLEHAVLVGHSVSLDIRFLEVFGVKTSGKSIDTLDIAQIFLPTHHSYNLENLMHFFRLSHVNAHRALADAKAVVYLLEKFAGLHSALKGELKDEFDKLLSTTSFQWKDLIQTKVKPIAFPNAKTSLKSRIFNRTPRLKKVSNKNAIFSFSFTDDLVRFAYKQSQKTTNSIIISVPDKRKVLELMRYSGVKGLFLAGDTFSNTEYKKFLNKRDKTPEEVQFLLKVLIWKGTNWQTQTVRDINVNFSGGQFLSQIVAKRQGVAEGRVLVGDHETFLEMSTKKGFHAEELVLLDLSAFEGALLRTLGNKISWNGLIYLLKGIYNPETGFGNKKYENQVISAMSAIDLFFGLVLLKLKPTNNSFEAINLTELDPYIYGEIRKASLNLVKKLNTLAEITGYKDLMRKVDEIDEFFKGDKEVRWVEYNSSSCIFVYRPIDISQKVSVLQKKFSKISILDRALSPHIVEYYIKRLSLSEFSYFPHSELLTYTNSVKYIQALGLENIKSAKLPIAVLYSTQGQVKRFYEANYKELKQLGGLLAQNVTGGSTKLIRNFGINPKSIMLASTDFVFRNSWANIYVESLFISQSGLKPAELPYSVALGRYLINLGIDYDQFYRDDALRKVLRTFYTTKLKNIQFFP